MNGEAWEVHTVYALIPCQIGRLLEERELERVP